jgi:hypothetical protein
MTGKRIAEISMVHPWNLGVSPHATKRTSVDMIKLRISRWGDYSGVAGGYLNVITSVERGGAHLSSQHSGGQGRRTGSSSPAWFAQQDLVSKKIE